jgi:hypothetical protein
MTRAVGAELYTEYDEILSMIVAMINRPEVWTIG